VDDPPTSAVSASAAKDPVDAALLYVVTAGRPTRPGVAVRCQLVEGDDAPNLVISRVCGDRVLNLTALRTAHPSRPPVCGRRLRATPALKPPPPASASLSAPTPPTPPSPARPTFPPQQQG